MRIGINAQRLTGQRLGVGRWLEHMLANWSRMLLPSETLTVFMRDAVEVKGLTLPPGSGFKVMPTRRSEFLWEQTMLPACSKEVDVLFGPSYTLPLAYPGRCVVATHSINEKE